MSPDFERKPALKIHTLAYTQLSDDPGYFEAIEGTAFGDRLMSDSNTEPDLLGEFAGRACYQAWELKNPDTAENAGYLDNIQGHAHYSVLEHSAVTFYVENVSRSLLLELERHGRNSHVSFSVESQRYVNTRTAHPSPVIPPLWREGMNLFYESDGVMGGWAVDLSLMLDKHYDESLDLYDRAYKAARDAGHGIKESREAARAFLPNATPVNFVITGDIRAWRDVITKRHHEAADAEIREFAGEVLRQLRGIAPNSFQDIPDTPYTYERGSA